MVKEKALYSCYLNDFKCKYYITKTNKTLEQGKDCINTFGIKIDMLSLEDNIQDTALLNHVGINENDVKAHIRSLYDGQAVPATLKAMSINKS